MIDAYKKGDIELTKKYKSQLDDAIEAWATSGGYEILGVNPKAAVGAMVYAVGELFIPTNAVDIVPVGKLGKAIKVIPSPVLKYEPAPYHGKISNPVKSKAPTNPQQSLNNSLQIKNTSDRRIAVDKSVEEFIIFDKTIDNIYHDHVRTWAELTPEMQNILIKNNLVDKKGKIK